MADGHDLQSAGIEVEVIHCIDRATFDSTVLRLSAGACVDDALNAAGILQRLPALDDAVHRIGIWGRLVSRQHALCDGDRVEIHRPLRVDPMQARRLRQRAQATRRPTERR